MSRILAGGKHLIVDGYACDPGRLADVERVRAFLDGLPERIGIKKIIPAYAFPWRDCQPEDWGVTGFVLISTSHIALHTFPERAFLYADAFSCQNFNEKAVLRELAAEFNIRQMEARTLDRGLDFSRQAATHVPGRAFCGGGGGG